MQKEKTNKVGSLIKKLREEKKLSQLELAELLPGGYICTREHLGRIERGEKEPTPHIINKLIAALGLSDAEFYNMLHGTDMTKFENDFSQIWITGFKGDWQTSEKMLHELKSKDYCNMQVPAIAQAILLCEATILSGLHKRYKEAIDTLHRALQKTIAKDLFINGKPDYKFIRQHSFSINEYRILKHYEAMKIRTNKLTEAIDISKAIIASLENEETDFITQRKLLPTSYHNLSTSLIKTNVYEEALELAEKGIKLCHKIKKFSTLGHHQYNVAAALHGMGNIEQARLMFQQSYDTHINQGDYETAESERKEMMGQYGIDIMQKN